MEHLESQLTAADVKLSDDVRDRLDEINPPAVTVNVADNGWTTPALQPAARRRRRALAARPLLSRPAVRPRALVILLQGRC